MTLPTDLIERFNALMAEAAAAGEPEPTAMSLATADANGRPSCRTVLLKGLEPEGFVFYTNLDSNKGRQLSENAHCALLFLWKHLRNQVQVKVEGSVQAVSAAEADAYFASRPRESQLGAWASLQSQTLPQRDSLAQRLQQYAKQFDGSTVPRPPHWSGFRVVPDMVEFWFGETYRLHDRERFELGDSGWAMRRLYP